MGLCCLQWLHLGFDLLQAVAGGFFQVKMRLEIKPELRGVSKVKREGQSGFGGDGTFTLDDIGDTGTRHTGFLSKAIGRDRQWFKELGDEDFAWCDSGDSWIYFSFDGSFHNQ